MVSFKHGRLTKAFELLAAASFPQHLSFRQKRWQIKHEPSKDKEEMFGR